MRYVKARFDVMQREQAYRIYVTDSLFYNARQKSLTRRYVELLEDTNRKVESPEEIISRVIQQGGLVIQDDSI